MGKGAKNTYIKFFFLALRTFTFEHINYAKNVYTIIRGAFPDTLQRRFCLSKIILGAFLDPLKDS